MKNNLALLFSTLKSKIFTTFSVKKSSFTSSSKGHNNLFYKPYSISDTCVGDFTYIATNSRISFSEIGKFCSIGPNFLCGFGVHPLNWISTHPMFYSTRKQNGMTFSGIDKIEERKKIVIWNDVFIGANVTVLDGVKIGDGAVIWAGAVVSKDIPPYAVAVGCPIAIKRFRFDDATINKFLRIKWWDFNESELKFVEEYFFDIEGFFDLYKT